MRISLALISAATIALPIPISPVSVFAAQAPSDAPALSPGSAQPAMPAVAVSAQLQPALSAVHETVDSVHIDKWKKGNVRDEAAQNISQIQRDLDVSLPPLMRDADTASGALSKLLPVSRNISALYDVLLRVVEASRIAAPDEQVQQLQKALVTLGDARLAFGDRMQASAVATERQVTDLRATVQTQAAKIAATPLPVALPCKPPPPAATRKTTHKPATKRSGATPADTKSNSNSSPTQNKPASSTAQQPSH